MDLIARDGNGGVLLRVRSRREEHVFPPTVDTWSKGPEWPTFSFWSYVSFRLFSLTLSNRPCQGKGGGWGYRLRHRHRESLPSRTTHWDRRSDYESVPRLSCKSRGTGRSGWPQLSKSGKVQSDRVVGNDEWNCKSCWEIYWGSNFKKINFVDTT